ncbi:META domain-containing protein [Psychromonas ossibalaenae]|uniref:META domain-containing protein n=1 Tax=Psychromonas ossibalaenae TaxID=444922 RepID=UPI000379CB49|nr:META domain-containing protein [Psychromonas ossibalaenae]
MDLFKTAAVLSTSLFLFSCSTAAVNNTDVSPATIELTQLQNEWQLINIDQQTINTEISSTITIDTKSKATGNLACNNFFGALELHNNQLRIEKMGSTRKICREPANEVEMVVASVLADWSDIQLDGQTLILTGKEHKLTYQAK